MEEINTILSSNYPSVEKKKKTTLQNLGIECTFTIVKAICDKPIASIILNGERLKTFLLRSGKINESPLSAALLNVVFEALATAIREENGIKGIQMEKKLNCHFLEMP